MRHIIALEDYALLLIYLIFLYYIIRIKAIKYQKDGLQKYFVYGFLVHMAGSVLYAMVVQYYYGYGDSFGFYEGSNAIRSLAASNNPFTIFFSDNEEIIRLYRYSSGGDLYVEAGLMNKASLAVYKITALVSYISFNSYLVISIFFGLFSFAGVWRLFCVFNDMQDKYFQKYLAYTVLFLPSICFWGSGLTKDSLCLGLVGFIFSVGYNTFVKKKFRVSQIAILIIALYSLFTIKSYIASALFLSSILVYLVNIILKSKGNIIKLSFVLLVLAVSGIFLSLSISSSIQSIIEESKTQIESFKNSYETSGDENSVASFSASDFEFSIAGIILRAPLGIGSTLYRPFIWETRKVIMLFSALESFLMLLAIIFVFIKCKGIHFFSYIAKNPEIFFAFIFVTLLSAIIGFTTFNFGTLVRYRLPVLPFYCFMLLSIYKKLKELTPETK